MGESRGVAGWQRQPKTWKRQMIRIWLLKNDPSDPITELFSCGNLIWVPNINQDQDVQADCDYLQYVAHSLNFSLTTAPPVVK